MKLFFSKEILVHPLVLSAVGVVALIVVASGLYYVAETRVPQNIPSTDAGATSTVITASGAIEPAQNPDLAFESGGRVARVNVSVGDNVSQGEELASLDIAGISAQRAQAAANASAQQATLDAMKAGARQVDIDAKKTGVAQASTALTNLYQSMPAQISQAYDKSFSGVSADTDTLFGQPQSPNPVLAFSTSNNQLALGAINARGSVNSELSVWQNETNTFDVTSPVAIETEISKSISHLQILRSYSDALLSALGAAISSSNFPQSSIAAAQTSVGTLRDSVNSLILSLQSSQQQIASAKITVQSANDALNQVLAGSTPQALEAQQAQVDAAQASVANIDAQIQNAIVVAPFSGTVSSVRVKVGQIIGANTPAISLNPKSALQISVYLSEVDSAKVKVGDTADATLDAYGTDRHWSATVVSIDQSPTVQSGVPGYKVVLQFEKADPAISSGMTANITIALTQ